LTPLLEKKNIEEKERRAGHGLVAPRPSSGAAVFCPGSE